jgi:hypothetical protein
MPKSFRLHVCDLAVAGFALSTLLGLALTPPAVGDPAQRLAVLADHTVTGNLTYAFRLMSTLLLAPALVGILARLRRRGSGLGNAAAALLLVGHVAGAAAVSFTEVQIVALAPAPNRPQAATIVELIDRSLVWNVLGLTYISGWLLGFTLLAAALWRTQAIPRWAAACIGLGPIVHIAGGDLPWTAIGGVVLLTAGLARLASSLLFGGTSHTHRTGGLVQVDPMEYIVSPDEGLHDRP